MEATDKIGLCFRAPKTGKGRFEVTFDDFSKIHDMSPPFDQLDQHEFDVNIGGTTTTWLARIGANGIGNANAGYVSLWFGPHYDWSHSLRGTVTIGASVVGAEPSAVSGDQRRFRDSRGCISTCVYRLISRETLFNDAATLLPDDKLSIVINASFIITAVPFTNPLYDKFPRHSDVKIQCVSGESESESAPLATLKANGVIVGWYSEELKWAFAKADCTGGKSIDLIVSPGVAKLFLRLAYGERFSRDDLLGDAEGLLKLAMEYKIPLLRYLAENLLIRQMENDNDAARCLRIADDCASKRLKQASFAFVRRTPGCVSDSNDLDETSGRGPDSSMLQLIDSTGESMSDCALRCDAAAQHRAKRLRTTSPSNDIAEQCPTNSQAGSKEFKLHRLVICSRSSVFRAAFNDPSSEEAKTGLVIVDDIEPDVMQCFVDLLYNRPVSDDSMEKYADGLLYATDKYIVTALKDRLETCLSRRLTAENCLRLLMLADRHSAAELKSACVEHVCDHWDAVKESEGMQHLPGKLLVEVIDALRRA